MDKAIAIANNDVVFLSWIYDKKIPNCLGFAIYRKDKSGARMPLPAWVGFKGGENKAWQPKDTTIWPVQKFGWKDLTAQRGQTYSYDIVPMVGTESDLKPGGTTLSTDAVTLTPKRGSVSTYFTNGILATQALTHEVPQGPGGAPSATVLKDRIDQPGDPLRNKLAGQVLEGLTALLNRAEQQGGACYCALYELNDPELIKCLLDAKAEVHLILSNTGATDAENKPARQTLHEAGVDITDRMLANGHIGHNKFVLYVDANQKPRAVLTGSTNWSYTGVCTQSNNALIIENDDIATAYRDYWDRLKADGQSQGQALRNADKTSASATIDGAHATVWYSPNMNQKTKPKNPPPPPDMSQVFREMAQAQYAILFLVFQPGQPSIIEYAAACENVKPGLLIYGAATDPKANSNFNTLLFHRTTKNPDVVPKDTIVVASSVGTQFAYWQKELLKLPGAHAIIHDKIVVIDPMSDNCVVVAGSHNLGYRASYNNDENFVIIKGHKPLAQAYATHVMDVYDHYRWRFTLKDNSKQNAFMGLDKTSGWQDKYFLASSSARREAMFWTGQALPLPVVSAPSFPGSFGGSQRGSTTGKRGSGRASSKPSKAHAKKRKRAKKKTARHLGAKKKRGKASAA